MPLCGVRIHCIHENFTQSTDSKQHGRGTKKGTATSISTHDTSVSEMETTLINGNHTDLPVGTGTAFYADSTGLECKITRTLALILENPKKNVQNDKSESATL